MNTNDYSVSELVRNPSFRRMVEGTANTEEISYWNKWIEKKDQNRSKAKEAASEILGFEFSDPTLPDLEKEWRKLSAKTVGRSDIPYSGTKKKDSALRWIYRVAAAILLIGTVGVASYYYNEPDQSLTQLEQMTQQKTVTTEEGEQKSLTFSNGARIMLNANTTLTYTLGLIHKETIRVDLQGEAYFKTNLDFQSTQPVFQITTPDGIVEDIGTEFLVTVENDRSRVILQEGLVKVKSRNSNNSDGELMAGEGELVEFNQTGLLTKQAVNSSFYTSWATGFIEFNRTEVHEFIKYVEQRFDVQVKVSDTGWADITLDGAVYFKSVEDLARAMSKVSKIPVYQSANRDTLYIGNEHSK